jgi:hypothetical protein
MSETEDYLAFVEKSGAPPLSRRPLRKRRSVCLWNGGTFVVQTA